MGHRTPLHERHATTADTLVNAGSWRFTPPGWVGVAAASWDYEAPAGATHSGSTATGGRWCRLGWSRRRRWPRCRRRAGRVTAGHGRIACRPRVGERRGLLHVTERDSTPTSRTAVMKECRSPWGPIRLVIPPALAIWRTMRAAASSGRKRRMRRRSASAHDSGLADGGHCPARHVSEEAAGRALLLVADDVGVGWLILLR